MTNRVKVGIRLKDALKLRDISQSELSAKTGISDSKMFIIYTKKVDELQNILLKNMATGVTIFNTQGGYKGEKRKMLMVVVPNSLYYLVKETILNIDSEAFFIISDCYEVKGGVKKKRYSFI